LLQQQSQQFSRVNLQKFQAPSDLQNECTDHLAEEESHHGTNVHYRNPASFCQGVGDPLQNLPKRLIEKTVGFFADALALKSTKGV
jgi:hypothetical protein